MKKCPHCGCAVKSESRFYCPRCGAALQLPEVVETGVDNPTVKLSKPKFIEAIIIAVIFVCTIIFAVIIASSPQRFRNADSLVEEYSCLISGGDEDKISELFLPEIISENSLSDIDGASSLYGTDLSVLGVYDVSSDYTLTPSDAQREIRNTYGVDVSPDEYRIYLAGFIIDGQDVWAKVSVCKSGKFWYIFSVS